jgi:hypothetical protein
MAAKKKVCKFGKVTRGSRKGHCRKQRKSKR